MTLPHTGVSSPTPVVKGDGERAVLVSVRGGLVPDAFFITFFFGVACLWNGYNVFFIASLSANKGQ